MLEKIKSEFLNKRNIAVVGVSRNHKGFGNTVAMIMEQSGYNVFSINKNAEIGNTEEIFPSISAVPTAIEGVVMVIPPAEAVCVINEASSLGIKNIWMQPGSESEEAKLLCQKKGINFISGECILMYMHSAGFIHKFHRWIHDRFERRETKTV